MSTKETIILTDENEHWFFDCAEPLAMNKDAMTLEFSSKNIRLEQCNKDYIVLTITNPNCEIYKVLLELHKKINNQAPTGEKK